MKTAIVYDRINKWGGAERVLLVLHEMFPDAPLYTSLYNPKTAPWASVFPKVIPSFLQGVPLQKHEWMAPLMPLAFESFTFDQYDLVISVTSEAAKGIITKPHTKHICYCLTSTRYLWSGYVEYFKGATFKGLTSPIVKYLREWDKIAAQRPDLMVGISTAVVERIRKYYNRDSIVIYPPVELKDQNLKASYKLPATSYYLVVSRLVPYKRVDLAIEAFNELGLPLVIVGTGLEENKLQSMAKTVTLSKSKNIKYLGQVSDEELVKLYRGARALIMPQEEDFGIVSVEAQAVGTPVIAYRKGGALDTVIEGRTGMFFDEQTVESLTNVVQKMNNYTHQRIKPEDCIENAKKFSKERFKREFLKVCVL